MTVRKRRRSPKRGARTAHDIWARTRLLVEILLEVMEKEISAPEAERSEQWLKLFGAKDSAVVNLQKLVTLLAELQAQFQPTQKSAEVSPVSAEEMAILSDWLKQSSAGSVSAAPES